MAIPLSVQIVSVIVLATMLDNAQAETTRVQQSHAITNQSLMIAKQIYDAEYQLYIYMEAYKAEETRDPRTAALFDELASKIPKQLIELRKLVSDRPQERQIAARMTRSSLSLLQLMLQMKRSIDRGERMEGVFVLGALMAHTMGPLNQISRQLDELIALQDKDKALEQAATRNRDMVQHLLYISVGINCIVVLVLLNVFNRGTISRLMVLMDNTRRLASQQPLNPLLSGKDEIAELDRVFHEVTDAMMSAQKRERELLEIKKQITAMVSHDLRAPLTSLQMTLNMLGDKTYGELNEQGKIRVKSSQQSVGRLIRMINDLLDLEKLEAGKMEMHLQLVPLPVIVVRSIEAVQELALEKNVEIDYDEKELDVMGDGDRLIQVLVNLLSNAVKFSPENSRIIINSQEVDGFVLLEVTDAGPGIPAGKQEQIFERFQQLDNKTEGTKKGTGLGLAIARIIMEQHGGSIGVKSLDGQGSTFWIKLPAATINAADD